MNPQEERGTRALDQTEDRREPGSGLFAYLARVGLDHTFNLQLNLLSRVSVLEAVMVHQSGFSLGFHLWRVANGWGDEVDLSARFGASRLAGRA